MILTEVDLFFQPRRTPRRRGTQLAASTHTEAFTCQAKSGNWRAVGEPLAQSLCTQDGSAGSRGEDFLALEAFRRTITHPLAKTLRGRESEYFFGILRTQ